MRLHRSVPADGVVSGSREKHKLPVCAAQHPRHPRAQPLRQRGPSLKQRDQPVMHHRESDERNRRDDEHFADSPRQKSRPRRQQARPSLLRVSHRRSQQARRVRGIGIGKKEELTAARRRELVAGPALSRPAFGQCAPAQQPRLYSRMLREKPLDDLACAVVRLIVHDDEFVVRVSLPQERAHAVLDVARLIPRGDEHGNHRRIHRHRRRREAAPHGEVREQRRHAAEQEDRDEQHPAPRKAPSPPASRR